MVTKGDVVCWGELLRERVGVVVVVVVEGESRAPGSMAVALSSENWVRRARLAQAEGERGEPVMDANEIGGLEMG